MKKENLRIFYYFFEAIGDLFIFASVIASSYLINLHFNKSLLNVFWAGLFMCLWIYSKYNLKGGSNG